MALPAPPIVPRSSAWACSNVHRRMAQAALAAVGRVRTVAGGEGTPGWPGPRFSHLFFLYVPMVTICSMIQRHTPLRRASSHRDTMGGQASAAWQVRNRCLMPAGVFESGKPGIRRGESQLRPRQMTGQQPNGSRRPARKAISPGRSAPRLSWRVPGGWPPRAQSAGTSPESCGRQIRGLALPCSSRWWASTKTTFA